MVVEWLDFFVFTLVPQFFTCLGSLMIAPGVSVLGLIMAVTLLIIVIGAVISRV